MSVNLGSYEPSSRPIAVGIVGGSGYTGAELLRILSRHPYFDVQVVTAHSEAGKRVSELFPSLAALGEIPLVAMQDAQSDLAKCELVFLALPHGESMRAIAQCGSARIIDLSSDFRLVNDEEYQRWYGRKHEHPEELGKWIYGLPELFREEIRVARKIANPGCFATATTLALAPLVCEDLVTGTIVVDAVSSPSGAGKSPSAKLHFSHACEDVVAYRLGNHQHIGEIEQSLMKIGRNSEVRISMTTHLVPISRGIHATCSVALRQALSLAYLRDLFLAFYKDEKFISIPPFSASVKSVRGANVASLFPTLDDRNNRVIVTAVIDNLVKGAAGTAVQNANLMFDLPEHLGLEVVGLYP